MDSWPARVSLREVGPRDGLQNEQPVPTAAKVTLIDRLADTGLRRIEAVSFVHPRSIPQMADADEVWGRVTRRPGVRYSALAPNLRGAQRALSAGFTEIEVVVSASDTHNRRNINRGTKESLEDLTAVADAVHAGGGSLEVIVATSFGCPYEGEVPLRRVLDVAGHAVAAGADRLAFGDTTGVGTPRLVGELVDGVLDEYPDVPFLLHFHNTRGTALANLMTAMEHGATEFDASVGGLGGCPYAPGASGNVATEEVVHLLEDIGVDTGVDLEALLEVAAYAQDVVGHELPSGVLKAGPRTRTVPV